MNPFAAPVDEPHAAVDLDVCDAVATAVLPLRLLALGAALWTIPWLSLAGALTWVALFQADFFPEEAQEVMFDSILPMWGPVLMSVGLFALDLVAAGRCKNTHRTADAASGMAWVRAVVVAHAIAIPASLFLILLLTMMTALR